MNAYTTFVSEFARLLREGRTLPLGGFAPVPKRVPAPGAPKALFFSPHPDDECISGGVALRILRETQMDVINVAVTQGSKKERQADRYRELQAACDYIGFGLVPTGPAGLERVNPKTRQQDPAFWAGSVKTILGILQEHRPRVVMFPHDQDWNGTHIGTHHLVVDALRQMPADFECFAVETEFWGQMTDPNLMLEFNASDVAELITGTSFHVGEVNRNPYHLLLPAWMMDNVRRGGELVGGQGGAAPDFTFAALYRLRKWTGGQLSRIYDGGKQVARSTNIGTLFA